MLGPGGSRRPGKIFGLESTSRFLHSPPAIRARPVIGPSPLRIAGTNGTQTFGAASTAKRAPGFSRRTGDPELPALDAGRRYLQAPRRAKEPSEDPPPPPGLEMPTRRTSSGSLVRSRSGRPSRLERSPGPLGGPFRRSSALRANDSLLSRNPRGRLCDPAPARRLSSRPEGPNPRRKAAALSRHAPRSRERGRLEMVGSGGRGPPPREPRGPNEPEGLEKCFRRLERRRAPSGASLRSAPSERGPGSLAGEARLERSRGFSRSRTSRPTLRPFFRRIASRASGASGIGPRSGTTGGRRRSPLDCPRTRAPRSEPDGLAPPGVPVRVD